MHVYYTLTHVTETGVGVAQSRGNVGRILQWLECPVIVCFIGKCFVDMKDDIQRVYGQYCRNHDSAIAVLEKVW